MPKEYNIKEWDKAMEYVNRILEDLEQEGKGPQDAIFVLSKMAVLFFNVVVRGSRSMVLPLMKSFSRLVREDHKTFGKQKVLTVFSKRVYK